MRATRGMATIVVASLAAMGCGGADEPMATDTPADREEVDQPVEVDTTIPAGVTSDAWSSREPAPTVLTEVGAAAFDGELWVVGGISDEPRTVTDVHVYDPASDSWRAGPALPEPVHHTAVVAADDQLVVVGGYVDLRFAPTADVFVLDENRPFGFQRGVTVASRSQLGRPA